MHLTKIILEGFKSFASQTTLEFKPGITAIVGPNGSGKSNIADAVRWVLGEQSYKMLRSKHSEDVIFSGSKTRNRLSKASVFLFLDNQDKKIPLEFSEIVIGRKFYRNGETDYLINNARVRLLDLKELLVQAGFGQKTYSVISQGMADYLINSTPQQRRELFEEAAQIKSYQFKRDQSQNKLLKTKENLQRIEDTLRELKPHLVFLKKQMLKKKKREKIEQQLSLLKEKFFKVKFSLLKKRLLLLTRDAKSLQKTYQQTLQIHQKTKKTLTLTQTKFQKTTQAIETIFATLDSLQKQKNKKEEELAIIQGTLKAKTLESKALEKMLQRERGALLEQQKREKLKMITLLNKEETRLIKKLKRLKKQQTKANLPLSIKIKNIITEFKKLKNLIQNNLTIPSPQTQQKIQKTLISLEKKLKTLKTPKERQESLLITLEAKLNTLQNQKLRESKEIEELNLKLKKITQNPLPPVPKKEDTKNEKNELLRLKQELIKLKSRIATLHKEKYLQEKQERKFKRIIFETERKERLLQDEIQGYQASYNELLKRIKTIQEELKRLQGEAQERLKLKLDKVTADDLRIKTDPNKIENRIQQLTQTLLSLPSIDQETVEEFHQSQKKYNFLLKEQKDLEKAISSLKDIIKKLNQIIQEKFYQSFAIINKEFKKYFRLLFEGGTAGLKIKEINSSSPSYNEREQSRSLIFQKRILQKSGIEIQASPPGKRLKDIHILSGGEKALTSLALLFAVFNTNPTPFCVLDEVDAALDEANSIKFGHILKKLSKKTQFLAITHNRETMRQANALYGITMSRDGVSKVISLSLTHAEEYANNE